MEKEELKKLKKELEELNKKIDSIEDTSAETVKKSVKELKENMIKNIDSAEKGVLVLTENGMQGVGSVRATMVLICAGIHEICKENDIPEIVYIEKIKKAMALTENNKTEDLMKKINEMIDEIFS